jgi:guanosine-3',5'-bis(diphosphate) 3'-pyrophosphohydrolase
MNLEDARSFCKLSHHGQTRWDGSPYFEHPFRVADRTAELLAELRLPASGRPSDDEILAAALLHDVIEDCGCDYEDISGRFGTAVADMVASLSDDKRLPEVRRLEQYRAALRAAPPWVQLVKLADIIDNAAGMATAPSAGRRSRWARKSLLVLDDITSVTHLAAGQFLRRELEAVR